MERRRGGFVRRFFAQHLDIMKKKKKKNTIASLSILSNALWTTFPGGKEETDLADNPWERTACLRLFYPATSRAGDSMEVQSLTKSP